MPRGRDAAVLSSSKCGQELERRLQVGASRLDGGLPRVSPREASPLSSRWSASLGQSTAAWSWPHRLPVPGRRSPSAMWSWPGWGTACTSTTSPLPSSACSTSMPPTRQASRGRGRAAQPACQQSVANCQGLTCLQPCLLAWYVHRPSCCHPHAGHALPLARCRRGATDGGGGHGAPGLGCRARRAAQALLPPLREPAACPQRRRVSLSCMREQHGCRAVPAGGCLGRFQACPHTLFACAGPCRCFTATRHTRSKCWSS